MSQPNQNSEIIFYTTPAGNVNIEVVFNNDTFWLTQKVMVELFGYSSDNISLYLRNIFKVN